jgi:hypothetical protein
LGVILWTVDRQLRLSKRRARYWDRVQPYCHHCEGKAGFKPGFKPARSVTLAAVCVNVIDNELIAATDGDVDIADIEYEEGPMLKSERDALLKMFRQRERVAKSEVSALGARRTSDFERQLAAIYSFDQREVWTRAYGTAREAWRKANEEIALESEEMGIPREFAPSLSAPHWFERGENMVRQRRVELTRVAYSRIEQMEKEAKLQIERSSVELQTRLLGDCRESGDAKAFLETMPSESFLCPLATITDILRPISTMSARELFDRFRLWRNSRAGAEPR